MGTAALDDPQGTALRDLQLEVIRPLNANRRLIGTLLNRAGETLLCMETVSLEGVLVTLPDRLLQDSTASVFSAEATVDDTEPEAGVCFLLVLRSDSIELMLFAWNPVSQLMRAGMLVGGPGAFTGLTPSTRMPLARNSSTTDGGSGENDTHKWSWKTGEFPEFSLDKKVVL